MPKKKLPLKKCIVCEKEYSGRGIFTITCSSKCSKAYQRIYYYISATMRKNLKQKVVDFIMGNPPI